MSDNRALFIEESIINGVKRLLAGRVNELLGEGVYVVPPVEFSRRNAGGFGLTPFATTPEIRLSACERTEKERIIRADAYSLTVTFIVPEMPEGERNCYAYAASVDAALGEDMTLGGVADRAVLTGKKYAPPKHARTGESWGLILSLRVTVEGIGL
jgi:hypothetical protein